MPGPPMIGGLDRPRDDLLDLLRREARRLRLDRDLRRHELGKDIERRPHREEGAGHQPDDRKQRDEAAIAYRPANERVHALKPSPDRCVPLSSVPVARLPMLPVSARPAEFARAALLTPVVVIALGRAALRATVTPRRRARRRGCPVRTRCGRDSRRRPEDRAKQVSARTSWRRSRRSTRTGWRRRRWPRSE